MFNKILISEIFPPLNIRETKFFKEVKAVLVTIAKESENVLS